MNLYQAFYERFAPYPDRTALRMPETDSSMTYGELHARSGQYAT